MTKEAHILPPLPQSWSALTWQQLCDVWTAKMRYGGNGDVAQAAALLVLALGEKFSVWGFRYDKERGESLYTVEGADGRQWTLSPRELAHMARQALPWLQYPYGDPGKEAVKDERGRVVEEAVEPHRGYVSPMRDAMILPKEQIDIEGITFALPQMACNNLTWHQYRALQALAPQLFQEGQTDGDALRLQAEFMAYVTVPEEPQPQEPARKPQAARDPFAAAREPAADPFRPRKRFRYVAERAEQTVDFWQRHLQQGSPLFHICFQVWQTAMHYYSVAYPLLFQGGGKQDPLRDALTGEVGTINTVMKYAGYAEQQQVYDSNLPFILDILNTMTKEAKEIEKMNSKIKRK